MADDFTQENRRLRIETPLGPDALLITALTGTEGVSTLFHFEVELLGRDERADFDAIVGEPVTVSVAAGGGRRYLSGICSRFSQGGTAGRHITYRAEIVPWLWFLTRTTDCRVFQNTSVPDLVRQIFAEYGFADYRFQLTGSYDTRDYCVQYRETDFNFVARLLEEEGIFYFFEHEDGRHTLVLADSPRAHQPCPVLDRVRFTHDQASLNDDDVVTSFSKRQAVRAGKVTLTDYYFETPTLDLTAEATGTDRRGYELYDYPAGATRRSRTEQLARLRQQAEDGTRVLFRGHSFARSLTPGFKVTLRGVGEGISPTFDGSYVLTGVSHRASESYAGGESSEVSYENDFECVPADVPFRPARRTPRPAIHGVQTAVVVGPANEEIFVDQYGRVKVQFHWDREGQHDENSSCWLRVSTLWAGNNWGIVFTPRIGQEVVVSFLEGDPDQPLITGSVYNADHMPPYTLPDHKTQSGIKTRSTPGGSPANFNEIRFEDKKGSEELYLHAERNERIVVEANKSESVGGSETITIGYDRTETVGHNETIAVANDRVETVVGNETLTVVKNRARTVSQNEFVFVALTRTQVVGVNDALFVGAAQETVVGGLQSIAVGGAQTVTVGAARAVGVVGASSHSCKKYTLDAGDEVKITTGAASLTMKKDGTIELKGKKILIEGTEKIEEKAPTITDEAANQHTVKSSMLNAEASAIHTIKGALVKINT
jgi:type VI secretion system secreted protein VgrG